MARRRAGRQRDDADTKRSGWATTGHEAELWAMADALRGSMDAAEYKHVVLGLIFLKYISDAFEERHAAVLAEFGEDAAEDRDEYTAENIFWVPPEARWAHLRAQARQSSRPAETPSHGCWFSTILAKGSVLGGQPGRVAMQVVAYPAGSVWLLAGVAARLRSH